MRTLIIYALLLLAGVVVAEHSLGTTSHIDDSFSSSTSSNLAPWNVESSKDVIVKTTSPLLTPFAERRLSITPTMCSPKFCKNLTANATVDGQGCTSHTRCDNIANGVILRNISFRGVTTMGSKVFNQRNIFSPRWHFDSEGGAVHFASTGCVTYASFEGNRAKSVSTDGIYPSTYGGAVFFELSGHVSMSSFSSNSGPATAVGRVGIGYARGGAVHFISHGSVIFATFEGNYAEPEANNAYAYGGAVFFGSNGNVLSSSFCSNSVLATAVEGDAKVKGGAMYFEASGSVARSSFSLNSAHATATYPYHGREHNYGGTSYFQSDGYVVSSMFTSNSAKPKIVSKDAYAFGGALNFQSHGSVLGSSFNSNLAAAHFGQVWSHDCASGGAVHFDGDGAVFNSVFLSNSVTISGVTPPNKNYNKRHGASISFEKNAVLTGCMFQSSGSGAVELAFKLGFSVAITSVHFVGSATTAVTGLDAGIISNCKKFFSEDGQMNTTCFASPGEKCSVKCDKNSGKIPGGDLECRVDTNGTAFSGHAPCIFCIAGEFANPPGSSLCKGCPAGWQSTTLDATRCSRCVPGKYASFTFATICKTCPKGHFSDHLSSGTRKCTYCSAGTYRPNIGASSCVQCVASQHCSGNVSEPTLCPFGFYCPLKISTGRPNGTMVPCKNKNECPHGSFCPPGHYCPIDLSEGVPSGISKPCRICRPGMYINVKCSSVLDTRCDPCPRGKYQDSAAQSKCKKCADNSIQADGFDSCRCRDGYLEVTLAGSAARHAHTCAACSKGINCSWPSESNYTRAWLDTVSSEPGYWQCAQWLGLNARGPSSPIGCGPRPGPTLPKPPVLRICPHRRLPGVTPPCAGGFDWARCSSLAYEGPLCAACAPGFYKNSSLHCVKCDINAQVAGIGGMAGLILLVVLIAACQFRKSLGCGVNASTQTGKKEDGCMEMATKYATDTFTIYNRIVGEKIKIVLTYSQLLTALTQPAATGTRWPLAFVDFIGSLGSFVNLNIFSVAQAACTMRTTVLSEAMLTAGTQLGVLSIGLAVAVVRQRQGKDTRSLKQALVLLTFLVYTGLSNTLCSFFKCTRLEDGRLHLSEDMRVLCYEGKHAIYIGFASAMILLFSICVPIGLVLILYRASKAGKLYAESKDDSQRRKPSADLAYLGSMFTRYDSHAYWFEAVHLLFKLYFSGVLVAVGTAELTADAESGVVGDQRAVNALQLVCLMLALLAYLLVSGLSQPYADYGDDVQWMVSLSSLLLCAFLAMMRQANFSELLDVSDDMLAVLLISFGVVPMILCVGRLAWALAAFGANKMASNKIVPETFGVRGAVGNLLASFQEAQDVTELTREELIVELRNKLSRQVPKQSIRGLKASAAGAKIEIIGARNSRLARHSSIDRRQHTRRHLTDENHAKLIIQEHHEEHAASQRQLAQAQEASAELGAHKRLLKEIRHKMRGRVLAEVLQTTLGLTGDDHIISFDHAVQLFHAIVGRALDREVVKQSLERCDKNGDGCLDLDELRRIVGEREQKSEEKSAEKSGQGPA